MWIKQEKQTQMVNGAKLDTARDSVYVNANRKERRERTATSPDKINTDPIKETENANEPLSTLALETVLRERLLEITHPRRQVRVCVCFGELVDVRLRGEFVWIASNANIFWSLV